MAAINQTSLYAENSEGEEYDVFISHASEDKASFVDELYHEFTEAGFKVWYDSACIKWGDSLRTKKDQGLANSRFGIVVLSKHFISKGWTQYELEGLWDWSEQDNWCIQLSSAASAWMMPPITIIYYKERERYDSTIAFQGIHLAR